jgi:hypothetical protein
MRRGRDIDGPACPRDDNWRGRDWLPPIRENHKRYFHTARPDQHKFLLDDGRDVFPKLKDDQ